MPDTQQALARMLLAGAILAFAAGLPALLIYLRARPASLFPRSAAWPISWSGWAVLVCFLAAMLVPSFVQLLLHAAGFFRFMYGPDFPGPVTAEIDSDPQASHLRALWSQTFAAPIVFALIVVGLKFGANGHLFQMGLARPRLGSNLVLGYLGWIFLTPTCFGVFFAAIGLLASEPQKHPLMDLGPLAGYREQVAFALQAAVLMPILEELLFRGVLLSWLLQTEKPAREPIVPMRFRSHVCYAAAVLLCSQTPTVTNALQANRWADLPSALAPFFFVVALLPGYLLLPFRKRVRRWTRLATPQAALACYANAVLFAAIHANVWPSPVPLFVLGLGLAWLTTRTRSIVPAIVVHGLFNAVAVIYSFLS